MLFLLLMSSCKKDSPFTVGDLTNEEITNIIKINFLDEYGGILSEEKLICQYSKLDSEPCNIDTLVSLENSSTNYNSTIEGEMSRECIDNPSLYNNLFIYFYGSQTDGRSEFYNIIQEFNLITKANFVGNTDDNKFNYLLEARRNLDFKNDLYKTFKGSISFSAISSFYDYNNCTLVKNTEFKVELTIRGESEENNVLNTEGTIILDNDKWTLSTDSGIETEIN